MNEVVKTLAASSVIAGLLSGVVSWLVSSYKIEQERHSRQMEAGYEALVKANTNLWHGKSLKNAADQDNGDALKITAKKLERDSEPLYVEAHQRIAAFGDARVVKAMSDYLRTDSRNRELCSDKEKFRTDTQIYKAIRDTMGVGGNVSEQDLATLMFKCKLE